MKDILFSHFQTFPFLNVCEYADRYVLWLIVFASMTKFYPIIELFIYLTYENSSVLLLNTLKTSMKKINLVTAFFYLQVV